MARQRISLAFLIEGEDKHLIGQFTCLKNALRKVCESEIMVENIEDGTYHLMVYSMYANEWLDFDVMDLEFDSAQKEDLQKIQQLL